MNKKENKLVPELRFPEFRNNGEWEQKKLEEIGKFIGGGTPDTTIKDYWDGEILWYTPTEVKNRNLVDSKRKITLKGLQNSSAKLLPIGTLLITTRATIGDVGISISPCTTNQGFQSLVVNKDQINVFWYYWLKFNKKELIKRSSGSTFPEIGKNEITKIIASAPQKSEQQKIADCLSSLDEIIIAHTEKLKTIKSHKKGLLEELFPMEGTKIPALRFKEFKNDWQEIKLGQVCTYFKGFAFQSKDYISNGRRIVRVSDMGFDYIKDETNAIYIDENKVGLYKRWKLKKNDLIITTVGSKPPVYDSLVGRTIVVKSKDENSLLNQNAVCIRANELIEQKFLNSLFKRNVYISFIESIIRGNANQGSIALVDLFEYKFLLPELKEQRKIAQCLSEIDNLIMAQTDKLQQLKNHKKGLMQRLFPQIT